MQINQDNIKVVQEGDDYELAKQNEEAKEDIIRKRVSAYDDKAVPPQTTHQNIRGSSRFSKGFNEELDRVADNITASFSLGGKTPITGESFSL